MVIRITFKGIMHNKTKQVNYLKQLCSGQIKYWGVHRGLERMQRILVAVNVWKLNAVLQ